MSQRVLFVDDDEQILTLYPRFFRYSSTEVDLASNLDEALALIEQQAYDLVITDLRLTQSQAFEGFQLIREARSRGHDIPFVIITGLNAQEIHEPLLELGIEYVLYKPFFKPELKAAVQALGVAIDDQKGKANGLGHS